MGMGRGLLRRDWCMNVWMYACACIYIYII